MVIHSAPHLTIYFGDINDQMYKDEYVLWQAGPILNRPAIAPVASKLQINELMFLRQTHSATGYNIDTIPDKSPFSLEGDYLCTQQQKVGLGVLTADCVPLVLYDRKNHACGIVHAGWKGAVNGVVQAVLEEMNGAYGSNYRDLQFFFGPSAGRCCYKVGQEFVPLLERFYFFEEVLFEANGSLYFDMLSFIEKNLYAVGVKQEQIFKQYTVCTICDYRFHSYRRYSSEKTETRQGRQMTIIALK